jgi:uncharacterized protein (TIGR02284 family)
MTETPEQKPELENDRIRIVLERLIDTCRDGEAGYRDAAEHIGSTELRAFFNQQSLERARFAGQLTAELERQGRWQTTRQGSVTGMVKRAWFDVERVLGGGDASILEAVESGEDAARDAYQKALDEPGMPESVRSLIRAQAQTIFASHDHIKQLRDTHKAA